jgi:hypothetical protein
VKALGGSDEIPGDPSWVRSDKKLPVFERVLHTVVGSMCIGETLSMRMIAKVREHTTEAASRAVMTQLAKDESLHGRFGWYLLELFQPHLDAAQKQLVQSLIAPNLAFAKKATVPESFARDRARNPFGDLMPEERALIFRDCLAQDIIPGFARLGYSVSAP